MNYRYVFFFLLFCRCTVYPYDAQTQTWDIGLGGGAMSYMGDLNVNNPFKFTDVGINLQAKINTDAYWSFKINFLQGTLRGNDGTSTNAAYKNRNLSFYTPFSELTAQVELNIVEYWSGGDNQNRFSPYLFTGIGFISFEPMRNVNGQVYHLRWYATEGQDISNPYDPFAVVVPVGFGVKYNLVDNFNVVADLGYRIVFSDYLDDVSGKYPNPSNLYDDTARMLSDTSLDKGVKVGQQRGDGNDGDKYLFVGIGLTYTFVSQKCRSAK